MKRKTGFSGSSAIPYLAVLLVVLLVLATVAFVHVSETDRHNDEYVLRVTEQRVIAEQLGKNILAASQGDEAAFVSLLENRDRYDTLMKELKTGAPDAGLPPVPAGVSGLVREMENTWLALRQDADEVLAAQDQLIAVRGQIDVVADVTPQLQELSEQVAQLLEAAEAPSRQVLIASRQMMLAQRLQTSLTRVFSNSGGDATALAIDRFGTDTEEFGRVLEGMISGAPGARVERVEDPAVRARLAEIAALFATINDYATRIIESTPALLRAFDAASNVGRDSKAAE